MYLNRIGFTDGKYVKYVNWEDGLDRKKMKVICVPHAQYLFQIENVQILDFYARRKTNITSDSVINIEI